MFSTSRLPLLTIFALMLMTAGGISAFRPPQAARRNLVPAKRALTLEARDLWKHAIAPKEEVMLNYGIATYHPPSAHVSFTAHDDRPVLLLEEFDHLLDYVSCTTLADGDDKGIMELTFSTEEAFNEALHAWTSLRSFTIISAHPTCNPDDERGAWIVNSVTGDAFRLTIRLEVLAIDLRGVGRSCRVKYDHSGYRTWDADEAMGIYARDDHLETDVYPIGYNPDVSSRMPIFPPPNITLVSDAVTNELDGFDIQLTCVGCIFKSNFSVGVEIDVDLGNASCVVTPDEPCFTLNKASMNFTVLEFEQSANLEVFMGGEFNKDINYTVLYFPIDGLKVGSVVDIGPGIGLEVGFGLGLASSINFTYGATAHIPNGAFASFDLLNSTGQWGPTFEATGWDSAGVDQIPFRINSGSFNMTAELYLAPYAEVGLTINSIGAVARVLQNVPKVTVNAELLTAVNRDCQPIGPDDFESFATAFAVGAGMEIGTVAHFEVDAGHFLDDLGIPAEYDFPFFTLDFPLSPANGVNTTNCFVLSDDSGADSGTPSGVDAAQPSPPNSTTLQGVPAATGTMFSAASAVPTWNMSKIESYYSANGHLPTNVNYTQMVQATTVPTDILQAVNKAASNSAGPDPITRGWELFVIVMLAGLGGMWV